jgi:hemolysin activation/secretion protein
VDLDLRYFSPVFGENSIGVWSVLRFTSGDTPFQDMPGIGGSFFLRGYPGRRYIDMAAFTADVEFRTAYFWRFSMVAFGSVGQVAGSLNGLPDEKTRFTGGAGLRFRLNDENFNVRMDVGFGQETSGFYLIAGEAF